MPYRMDDVATGMPFCVHALVGFRLEGTAANILAMLFFVSKHADQRAKASFEIHVFGTEEVLHERKGDHGG